MQIVQIASTVPADAPATGREAKRDRTRRTVEKAAVRLALEHGVANVTVDQICEASEISARTFFNYFGTKDAAIVGTASKVPPQDLLDEFVAAEGPILGDFLHALVESIRRNEPDAELIQARRRLFDSEPSLAALRLSREASARDVYKDVVRQRLRRERPAITDAEAEAEAILAVATALGVLHAAGARWVESGGTSEIDPLIAQTIDRLRRLL